VRRRRMGAINQRFFKRQANSLPRGSERDTRRAAVAIYPLEDTKEGSGGGKNEARQGPLLDICKPKE
jgi:hypothetical protein